MTTSELVDELELFLIQHPNLHPDCSLFVNIHRLIEVAKAYMRAGIK